MSERQLKLSQSKPQAEAVDVKGQRRFGRLMGDIPATQLSDIDLAELINANSHPLYITGRTGSIEWAKTLARAIPGRTGYTASRKGNIVTITRGQNMVPGDIYGQYFVWKTGENDQIIEYLGPRRFRTRQTGDVERQEGCFIRGAGLGRDFYKKTKKIITHWDTRLFLSDWQLSNYTVIQNISFEELSVSPSQMSIYDDNVFIRNVNGTYKVNLLSNEPYYYKINTPVPTEIIESREIDDDRQIGRRYIYSMSRLINGKYYGNRAGVKGDATVPTLLLEQESGTTRFDTELSRDYGAVFTELDVGLGNETYGILDGGTGGVGVGITEDIALWAAIATGTFMVDFNGQGFQTVYCDFTGVQTLEDVRAIIEAALRVLCASATITIEYDANGDSFWRITSGKINGSTVSLAAPTAPVIGIDISNVQAITLCGIRGTAAAGGVLNNNANYTDPSIIGDMECAAVENSIPRIPEYHWTHLSMYSSMDPAGEDPTTRKANNPEQYIWNNDVPIMKAFTVRQSAGNILSCSLNEGLFNIEDVGNTVIFQDLRTTVIQNLCDENGVQIFTPTSRWAIGNTGAIGRQSATLGANHTLTISKRGYRVTLRSGTRRFTAADVRKPLFCADGEIIYIREYVSPTIVNAFQYGDKPRQAAAIDPDNRRFNDTMTDQRLRDRLFDFSAHHRQHEHLPDGDLMTIVPGFMIVATKGESKIYYSSMARLYRTGYHLKNRQFDDKIKDVIDELYTLPDKCAALCDNSVWITPTQAPLIDEIEEWGVSIPRLPSFVLMDNIGCIHTGTIQEIDIGKLIMVTSEAKIRVFDGIKFQDVDLSEGQVEEILKMAATFTVSLYSPYMGYINWFALSVISTLGGRITAAENRGYGTGGDYGTLAYKQDALSGQLAENKINRYDGRCIRYAVERDQGQGFSVYENEDYWLWPEPFLKPLKIIDDNGQSRWLVWDEISGKAWETATRDGAKGSGLKAIFTDKQHSYGGVEIWTWLKSKEYTADREHKKQRHMVTHVHYRPQLEKNKGKTGYKANGLRDAFYANLNLFKQGETEESARTIEVPIDGDLTYDRRIEANRLQTGIWTSASEYKLVGFDSDILTMDKKASREKSKMTELKRKEEYDYPYLWITRGPNPILNRATSRNCDGDFFNSPQLTPGPDGKNSALMFAPGYGLVGNLRKELKEDFSIQFAIKGEIETVVNFGTLALRFMQTGNIYNIVFDDGRHYIVQPLAWKGEDWEFLKISRRHRDLTISENGALVNTHALLDERNYGNRADIMRDQTGDLYDLRIDPYVSEQAFEYYYRDVIEHEGDNLLPPW